MDGYGYGGVDLTYTAHSRLLMSPAERESERGCPLSSSVSIHSRIPPSVFPHGCSIRHGVPARRKGPGATRTV
jgi:hypothetical protein